MPGKPFAIETEKLNDLFDRFNYKTLDDILAAVGEGLVSPREFLNTLDHDLKHNKPSTPQISEDTPPLPTPPMPKPEPDANNGTIIGLIPGMAMRYAGCCHPIPGDKIVGIITTGRGVTIHTCDCTNLKRFDHQTERWLDISWNTNLYKQADQHIARFHSIISNTKGALGEFSSLIGRQSVNIVNLKIINRTEEIFEILIDLEVDNAEQTKEILGFLRSSPVVQSIERSKY
jgi:guanosine-3',5'-bis(diphosphate) 3'-pyrophosphohydrolase